MSYANLSREILVNVELANCSAQCICAAEGKEGEGTREGDSS